MKPVYKRRVGTHHYVRVGMMNSYGLIDLDIPRDKEITTPTRYYPEFYIDVKIVQEVYSHSISREFLGTVELGTEKKPFNFQNLPQEVKEDDDVIGYITGKERIVYYDQYL